jgi:adenosylcobinamide kinase / adenosylcobinamide-phosphate guanylyltransferase
VITLVLGGARSGKSVYAEKLVAAMPEPVTYVATMAANDPDMSERIAVHRERRPPTWATVEAGQHTGQQLADVLAAIEGTALLDALGPWVASAPEFTVDAAGLCRVLQLRRGDTVVVSEEVGLGVHPTSALGRQFRDALGELNQAVAEVAEDAVLVVAGRILRLEKP